MAEPTPEYETFREEVKKLRPLLDKSKSRLEFVLQVGLINKQIEAGIRPDNPTETLTDVNKDPYRNALKYLFTELIVKFPDDEVFKYSKQYLELFRNEIDSLAILNEKLPEIFEKVKNNKPALEAIKIAARIRRRELVRVESQQVEDKWSMKLWTKFNEYKNAAADERDGFLDKAIEQLETAWGSLKTNPELFKNLLMAALAVGELIEEVNEAASRDDDNTPAKLQELESRLAELEQKADPDVTHVAESQNIYDQLQARVQAVRTKWQSKITNEFRRRAEENDMLEGEVKDYEKFYGNLKKFNKYLQQFRTNESLLASVGSLAENGKQKIEEYLASIRKGKDFLNDDDVPQMDRDRLQALYDRLVLEANIILGKATENADLVFTKRVKDWLTWTTDGDYAQVESFWSLYQAGNYSVLEDDVDEMEEIAERLQKKLEDLINLDRSHSVDVEHHNRANAIMILLNQLQEMVRGVGTKDSKVKSGEIVLEIPPDANKTAWRKAFKEALDGRTDEEIKKFLKQQQVAMEKMERDYEGDRPFSEIEEGYQFAGLREFLSNDVEGKFNYYYLYFKNRLAIMDVMSPYANSLAGSADVIKVLEKYPSFQASHLRFFLGTDGTSPDKEGSFYEHWSEVRQAILTMEELRTEQFDFTKKNPTRLDAGFFSFGRGKWMGKDDDFYTPFIKTISERLQAINKDLTKEDLAEIVRIAFSTMTLNGGFAELFMSWWAVGKSPPWFLELELMMEIHPLAQALNSAKETVVEIPAVVMGLKMDPKWLLKKATEIGIYKTISDDSSLQWTGYNAGRLWGLSGAPDVTNFTSFKSYINSLSDNQAWLILNHIRDQKSGDQSSDLIRFRNILKSIHISEVKADLIEVHHKKPQQLLDTRGELQPDGDIIASAMTPPGKATYGFTEFVSGGEAGYFARNNKQTDVFIRVYEAFMEIKKRIFSSPVNIPKGTRAEDAIEELAEELTKTFKTTSKPKTNMDFVDWEWVLHQFNYKLYMLFATYRLRGYGDPLRKPVVPTAESLKRLAGYGSQKVGSLVEELRERTERSGQLLLPTRGWLGRSRSALKGHPRSDGALVSFKEYLLDMLKVKKGSGTRFGVLNDGLFRAGTYIKSSGRYRKYTALLTKYGVGERKLNKDLTPSGALSKISQEQHENAKKRK